MALWRPGEGVCEALDRKCANCWLFGWKHPNPSSIPLKKCTGCRKIYYDILAWIEPIKIEELIKKPKKSFTKEQMHVSEMVKGGSYLRVVDKILEVLEKRVVSHEDLAAIVCDGDMQRICSGCNRDIVIQEVGLARELGLPRGGTPAVMFQPGQNNLFSCGAKACDDQMVVKPEVNSWVTAVIATAIVGHRNGNHAASNKMRQLFPSGSCQESSQVGTHLTSILLSTLIHFQSDEYCSPPGPFA